MVLHILWYYMHGCTSHTTVFYVLWYFMHYGTSRITLRTPPTHPSPTHPPDDPHIHDIDQVCTLDLSPPPPPNPRMYGEGGTITHPPDDPHIHHVGQVRRVEEVLVVPLQPHHQVKFGRQDLASGDPWVQRGSVACLHGSIHGTRTHTCDDVRCVGCQALKPPCPLLNP